MWVDTAINACWILAAPIILIYLAHSFYKDNKAREKKVAEEEETFEQDLLALYGCPKKDEGEEE